MNPWIVTAAVMLATLEILDTTVVNVSIQHIVENLGATVDGGVWPQVVYGVAMGFLFIPQMAVSVSGIKKEKMGNATS